MYKLRFYLFCSFLEINSRIMSLPLTWKSNLLSWYPTTVCAAFSFVTLKCNCTGDTGSTACEKFCYLSRPSPRGRPFSGNSRTRPRRSSGFPVRLLRHKRQVIIKFAFASRRRVMVEWGRVDFPGCVWCGMREQVFQKLCEKEEDDHDEEKRVSLSFWIERTLANVSLPPRFNSQRQI